MEELKALIGQADDDYLIGLSNKGTVKRAYKDLEQESPALIWQDKEAKVTLKEATCNIRVPLGESGCSCPSQSICRHIVTAILWLKKEYGEKKDELPDKEKVETVNSGRVETTDGKNSAAYTEKNGKKAEFEEILNIPTEQLKRACGSSRFRRFLAHMQNGELPDIAESSIITIVLPWENVTIKLLEPFSYSTCSCHSKELCVHKAQAVLAYQIKKGRFTIEDLENMQESEAVLDISLVSQTCNSICEEITIQLSTGLSRQSPEVSESMERLAVISHRAGIPELESRLREAAADYKQYFGRSAAFDSEVLLDKLLEIYERADKLRGTQNQEMLREMAGAFRDAYEPVGKLRLVCMGGRTFLGKAGYEGEIYYFWETKKQQWYTWTDARPIFYEDVRKKSNSGINQAQAPWGLNCSREQMQELEFELINAKASHGGRLSASQETKAEIIGNRSLEEEDIRQIISWDYERLLADKYIKESDRRERLAVVGAVKWGKSDFDEVLQRFSWSIYDKKGRRLNISIKYTKEERLAVNMLERLEQRLKNHSDCQVVFFGSLYIDEKGHLCMFPINFFIRKSENITESDEVKSDEGLEKLSLSTVNTFAVFLREAKRQITDLFVSGLSSVWDEAIKQLSVFADDAERLGLHKAGRELEQICSLLKEKHHQMEFNPEPVLKSMVRLNSYLLACRKRTDYDTAFYLLRETDE